VQYPTIVVPSFPRRSWPTDNVTSHALSRYPLSIPTRLATVEGGGARLAASGAIRIA
jgi:hypothetical protein